MKAISAFPVPTCKRQLMRFLGTAGYYRKFCNNFSVIAEPLTNLLSKRTKFVGLMIARRHLIYSKPYARMSQFSWHQILKKNLSLLLTLLILAQAVFCVKKLVMVTFRKKLTSIRETTQL